MPAAQREIADRGRQLNVGYLYQHILGRPRDEEPNDAWAGGRETLEANARVFQRERWQAVEITGHVGSPRLVVPGARGREGCRRRRRAATTGGPKSRA